MKRGTAAKVILGKDTLMDVPAGIVHGTDVILGGKAGLLNDFGGLVLSNNLMLGKKVSRGTITTVTVRGQSPLVLPDAIAGSLQAVKAFGGIEQNGTPTPASHVDIVSNNGVLGFQDSELPSEYRRVLGYACDNDVLWQITGFHLRGSDTVRISFSVTAACNVFGCYQGTDATDNYDLYVSATSGSRYLRYGDGTYLSYWSSANMGQRFDVVFTPTGTSGMPQDSTWSPMTFESANNLLLAATTLTGTSSKLRGNLYGSFVVDGRLNLIPCERLSDSSLGYYDTYTGTFYEPTGTPTSLGYDYTHCGIVTSGPIETINAHGKNLFDLAASENLANNGLVRPTKGDNELILTGAGSLANFSVMSFAKVADLEGKTVVLSYDNPTNNGSIVFAYCDADGTNRKAMTTSSITISSLDAGGRTDIALRVNAPTSDPTEVFRYTNIQIEQGSTATEYQPYYDGGTATAEMLLKVGDYQDVQSIIDGVVTRNVGIKVLDGTENWVASGNLFYAGIATDALKDTHSCYCTHFKGVATNASANYNNEIKVGTNATQTIYWTRVQIYPVVGTYSDVNAVKQYLADQYAAGTPVIVVYPLATPTTESVAGQPLQVQAGDNVLEITQAGMDGLELEATYKSLVQLTIEEVEDANLNNNVEVTIS